MHVCVYACMCVCMYACMYVNRRCMCACINVHTHTHTHTHTNTQVNPESMGRLYRDIIIPLTKDVEVDYLMKRVQ